MKWIITSLLFIAVSGKFTDNNDNATEDRLIQMSAEDPINGVKLTLFNRNYQSIANGMQIWPTMDYPEERQHVVWDQLRRLPMKIVVHGFWSKGDKWRKKNEDITKNLLVAQDCNVLLVDWSVLAKGVHSNEKPNRIIPDGDGLKQYVPASMYAMDVGEFLAGWLLPNICQYNQNIDIHLIGHSLGAHAVGKAGRMLSNPIKYGLNFNRCDPKRVTGLDPAGPMFEIENARGWSVNPALEMIGKDSGLFVDIIHTNAGALGAKKPLGDVDFYVNGGRRLQQGPEKIAGQKNNYYRWLLADKLSHSYAKKVFIKSLLDPNNAKYKSQLCGNMNNFPEATYWDGARTIFRNTEPICTIPRPSYVNYVGWGAQRIKETIRRPNVHYSYLTDKSLYQGEDAVLDEDAPLI